jgi:ATP-dependent HslUV protease ATP-binding subunit HslU
VLEKMLDEISFNAPDMSEERIVIDAKYVKDKISEIVKDRDLSRYIL